MANIKILLVDDIDEVRENVKKLLSLEKEFEVIGSSGSGREGIKLAKELKPDVIIMDINMPDIDGIAATREIKRALPATGVIMMSVNSDRDYLRRAMKAGASDFLTKPANMDDLFNTIHAVYEEMELERKRQQAMIDGALSAMDDGEDKGEGSRAGHIVVCFSPKGGVGTTTIATNLASGLMRDDLKVLLIDTDVQFGDISTFLNLKAQSTIADIIADADDMDNDLFENVLVTHPSGLKVLVGPTRPEFAEQVYANPTAVAGIINTVRYNYDVIVIDTASRLDDLTVSLCDIATQILLISTPTLPSIRGVRFVLDLFDQIYDDATTKIKLVLTQVHEDKRGPKITIPEESIVKHLKRDVYAAIPSEEKPLLQAIIKGVPIIALERDTNRSPVKEILGLAEKLRRDLMGENTESEAVEEENKGGWGSILRR